MAPAARRAMLIVPLVVAWIAPGIVHRTMQRDDERTAGFTVSIGTSDSQADVLN
jgi:hypothetical protein